MLFHKLFLVLPAVLSASAAPNTNSQTVMLGSLAGPGAHVDGPSPCTDVMEFYGRRRRTYIQAQWCLKQQGDATVITQKLSDAWYYFGGIWFKGGKYELAWETSGQLSASDEPSEPPHTFSKKGTNKSDGTTEIASFKPQLQSTDYYLGIDFRLVGPYWEEDSAIDAHFGVPGLRLSD